MKKIALILFLSVCYSQPPATYATINVYDDMVNVTSNGCIQGIQMTLLHSESFSFELEEYFISESQPTSVDETTIIQVAEDCLSQLFTYIGDFEIVDIVVSNNQGEEVFSNIEYHPYEPGDLNVDNEVNVLDVVLMINMILDGSFDTLGDLNYDNQMNVLDVVLLVNNILEDEIVDYGYFNSEFNFVGSDETLDIITWNIEWFPKHNNTIEYVANAIDIMDVDIIALQEIRFSNSLNELKELLGNNWHAYRAPEDQEYGALAYLINTNAIAYQAPYTILNSEEYWFAYRPPYVLEFLYNNQPVTLINVHYKCCGDDFLDFNNEWDEEYRRLISNEFLHGYINENYSQDNLLVVGDMNDSISENNNNVFGIFLDDDNFLFTDMSIANGSSTYWSYPSWPSHLDHILLSNELFEEEVGTSTLLIDYSLDNGWNQYNNIISDHRPMGISLFISP